jgi:hypothetical protein
MDGATGPIDFQEPDNASAWAEAMLSQIDAGVMPPPVADPSCRDYQDSERMFLPEQARDLLAAWIDEGKPIGEEADLVIVEPVPTQLENPDLKITLPKAYMPVFEDAENPGNEYRCFYIEHDRTEDFFLTGMAPAIDSVALAHHIVIAKAPKDQIKDKYKTDDGWSCINGEGTNVLDGMIAGWAPGTMPMLFDEGSGMRIGKDDAFILQMHYYNNGQGDQPLTDQSAYEFTTVTDVDREVLMFPLGPTSFRIPAGEANHTESMSFTIPNGITASAHGTFPHMHVIGSSYRLWVEHEDGSETCGAQSNNWDFDNQITYMFNEPVLLIGGDTIHFECSWDNSKDNPDRIHDEPIDVRYGERTDEEMCFAFTFLSLGH